VLRLRLLGAAELTHVRDPATPLRLGRSAALQILAFLALHPGGATSTELAAALWPGVRPRPTDRFYTAVNTLRSTVTRTTGVEIVTRADERYRLNPTHLQVDLWRFNTAIAAAANAIDPDARTAALRTVIGSYTGDLAAGHEWAWLPPYRETVRRHTIDAYTALTEGTDPHETIVLLHAALRVDPINEDLYQRAMRAHAAAAQPGQINALLAALTRRLATTADKPSPDTEALARQLTSDR